MVASALRNMANKNAKMRVGLVGWRGMVGSVLMDRMRHEQDFALVEPSFFSTSNAGGGAPDVGQGIGTLLDGNNVDALSACDAIISCQGGDYTKAIHPKLRSAGWQGYWIDAASSLRLNKDAVIILDPINGDIIKSAVRDGVKDFIGGNCTVSLMMMGLHGLFKADLIEWLTSMTYQAASGAGAANMRELLSQMGAVYRSAETLLSNPSSSILQIDQQVSAQLRGDMLPKQEFGFALAGSLLPWIDTDLGDGSSREERKGSLETNKILGRSGDRTIGVDGLCVRIGAMRCHSQALTIKLRKAVPLDDIHGLLANANPWTKVISNTKVDSLTHLTPAAVNGTLTVPVGRLRKLDMGDDYLTAFTCGDQLLWGAAEPLRRMLSILIER
jgi:aspartate-semialdehyde dehydrogenase